MTRDIQLILLGANCGLWLCAFTIALYLVVR